MSRILAIDLGKVRSGVAVSDPTWTIAQPLRVVEGAESAAFVETLRGIIAAQEPPVERVIVGIPRSLSGRRGPMAYWAEGVRRRLAEALAPLPVDPWDETLSSSTADSYLQQTEAKRQKRRQTQDAVAAAVILQDYLDRRHARP